MRIKPRIVGVMALCAAQLALMQAAFALPQVEDAGDSLASESNNSGYLSSAPVAAPEVPQNIAQKDTSLSDDLLTKINTMEQELQSLQGHVDELEHALKQSQTESAQQFLILNKKLAEVPAPKSVAAVPVKATVAPAVATPVAVVAKTAPAATPEAQEKATYDAAYSLVSAKAYADAIEAFKGYLTIYPDGKYAPQANYWLGELNASQQLYPAAIKYLEIVVNQYPKSSKAPDAMLKLGIINKRLGDDPKAQKWFARVMKEYPQSTSAQSAKEYITN